MKKAIVSVFAAAFAAASAFAVTTGSYYLSAASASVGGSKSVKLVKEYDEFDKSYDSESGIYCYKVTLKKNTAYTVWIQGGSAANMSLDVDYLEKDSDSDDKVYPMAEFDVADPITYNGATVIAAHMTADSWDADDPSSFTYIITITGDVGAKTTLYVQSGIRNFSQVGDETSPRALTFSTTQKTYSAKLIDGSYWFKATLAAGCKYLVRTTGGTKAKPLGLVVDSSAEDAEFDVWDNPAYTNAAVTANNYNDAFCIVPETKGTYLFNVNDDTKGGDNASGTFTFAYKRVPALAIASHKSFTLSEENGWSAEFVPGRMSVTDSYYDSIIDEHLCGITLAKGDRVVFDTEGAASPDYEMIAYDSTGKIIARNASKGNGLWDMRVAVEASAAGKYYVGVYETTLDVNDSPSVSTPLTLTAIFADEYPASHDAADPADDVFAGATEIVPAPASLGDELVDAGSRTDSHTLDGGDWCDWFKVACRSGQEYRFRAVPAEGSSMTDVALAYEIGTINAKGAFAKLNYGSGTKVYVSGASLDEGVTLRAYTNAVHYIKVYTALQNETESGEGDDAETSTNLVSAVGLDYPDYQILATVAKGVAATDAATGEVVTNSVPLGLLKVNSTGVAGTYSIGAEKMTYPVGTTLALPTGDVSVKFNAVSGFHVSPDTTATTTNLPATVAEWSAESSDPAAVTGAYYDVYDKKFAYGTKKTTTTKTVNGRKTTVTTTTNLYSDENGDLSQTYAFSLATPTNTERTIYRSLYAADKADNFKFTAAAARCYNFSLTDYAAGGAEGAVLTITNAVDGVLAENVKSVEKLPISAGVTYVTVSHAPGYEDKDSSYSLTYNAYAVGQVGFTAANFTAKESAEYATLTLKRTMKQGIVSVKWATEAGTAEPGKEYYPTNGVVTWASGDMANKTIKVRLIPDLVATWESNKVFSVRLWANDRADFAANEWPAMFIANRDAATVTLTEVTAVKPGTVSITGFGPSVGEATNAVSNVKSPVATGQVGAPLVLRLSRTGGTNGVVGVKLGFPAKNGKTADTAKKNVDYVAKALTDGADNTVVWDDFDAEDKYVTIETLSTTNYTYSKQFTVSLAALTTKGYSKPALSATLATAKLLNNTVGTTAASYANTTKAAGAVQTVTGTWFLDRDTGAFRSGTANGILTYTLTGPGFFAVKKPAIRAGVDAEKVSTATLRMQIGALNAKKAFVASETIDLRAEDAPDRVERIIASGSRIVRFVFSGGNGSEYVEFDHDDDTGLPFKWVRFATVAVDRPISKSVVATNGLAALKWTLPAALADEKVYIQPRLATTSALKAAHNLGDPSLVPTSVAIPDGTLLAGKTYYWTLAFARSDEAEPEDLSALAWTAHPTTWNFSVLANGNPQTVIDGFDLDGNPVAELVSGEKPVRLVQTVKASLQLAGTASANRYRLLAGKLPTGLSINATSGKISGAPSAAGDFTALLQSYRLISTKSGTKTVNTYKYGTTVQVKFTVEPAGLAVGGFRGALYEDGDQVTKNSAKSGFLTVSVTSAGAITANAKISGNTYKFTATGFDEIESEDEDAAGLQREYAVSLKNITKLAKKSGKTTTYIPYTNTLDLVIRDAPVTNAVALGEAIGSARLVMNIPNNLVASATAMEQGIEYKTDLYRASANTVIGKAAIAPFAGYYTVALVPTGVTAADGVPVGNGYLTLTLAESGAVTIAGVLADGAAITASSAATVQGDLSDIDSYALYVPVHYSANIRSLSGVLRIVYARDEYGNAAPIVDSTSTLLWSRDAAAAASYDALGYAIEIAPTGGWYNKTWNVQRHYLDSDLAIQAAGVEDLALVETTGALTAGYEFKTDCTPNDLAVKLTNNAASLDARTLVKDTSTLLYDLAKSVNPWSATFTYTRATGLVSGQFNAWTETTNATKQVQITKIPHKGVMLFNRDDASPLDENAWSAGYYLIQATKNWKASLPFNVIATPIDGGRDWNEVAPPSGDEEEEEGEGDGE